MEWTYSQKLRALADYLDSRPELEAGISGLSPWVSLFPNNAEHFATLVSKMGNSDKAGYGGTITATHYERDQDFERVFAVEVSLTGACEKVVKTDDNGNPILKPKQEWIETGELEPEYEWKCPESFLKVGDNG